KAPVESLMPLRLARYGVPLAETAPSGLAAAGIEPALLPPAPAPAAPVPVPVPELERPAAAATGPQPVPAEAAAAAGEESSPWFATPPQAMSYDGGYDPSYVPEQEYEPWYQEQQEDQAPGQVQEQLPTEAFIPAQMQAQMQEPEFPVPSGPNRTRQLGEGIENGEEPPTEEDLYQVFRKSIDGEGGPTPGTFHANVEATFGTSLEPRELQRCMELFMQRLNSEFIEDHIA
ncbi:DUF2637 domain-containing protein, partial [Streptomyces sp. NPDC055006]